MSSIMLFPAVAFAASGQPAPYELGLQQPATKIAEQIHDFHTYLMWIITIITLFVVALLIYVMIKFNEKANPIPSKTAHHTMLEFVWTIAPILILIAIAIPSFRLLFAQYDYPEAQVRIKATGIQWAWQYQYPGTEIDFESRILSDEEAKQAKRPRLLAVDNPVVVPVGQNVEILVTSTDVLHAWTIPSFGVKTDAIPGRVVRIWFNVEKEGIYYGQCSELCGKDHAFMPIEVRVVSADVYKKWKAAIVDDEDKAKEVLAAAQRDWAKTGRLAAAAIDSVKK